MRLTPESGTVFIVDDDESFLRSVSRFLRAAGYSVQAFESAKKFLNELSPGMSGCVLADLQMPGLNGLEICRQVRNGQHASLPVLMLTARADARDRAVGLAAGADDYVTKPFAMSDLIVRVRALLCISGQW